jgi:hypothetical protein
MNRKSSWSPSEHGGVARAGLEGSRFGTYLATLATFVSSLVRPKRVKAGGSRERPIGSQLYGPGVNQSKAKGKCIALGLFPGAARCNSFWPDGALKQISRGRLLHAKAAPLQTLGGNTACQSANPFEDDYEYEHAPP